MAHAAVWPEWESDAARLSHSSLSNRCPRNREFSLHVPEVTGGGKGGEGEGGGKGGGGLGNGGEGM